MFAYQVQKRQSQWILWAILAGLVVLFVYGCQESGPAKGKATTQPMASASTKGGAQLWGEWCVRCHNLRPPQEFSNAEWQVVVHHMRVRANLTGEEQREIVKFLKSASGGAAQ